MYTPNVKFSYFSETPQCLVKLCVLYILEPNFWLRQNSFWNITNCETGETNPIQVYNSASPVHTVRTLQHYILETSVLPNNLPICAAKYCTIFLNFSPFAYIFPFWTRSKQNTTFWPKSYVWLSDNSSSQSRGTRMRLVLNLFRGHWMTPSHQSPLYRCPGPWICVGCPAPPSTGTGKGA